MSTTRRSHATPKTAAMALSAALLAAACAGASDAAPAPAQREITSLPTTVTVPPTTANAGDPLPTTTEPPPPLDYSIEFDNIDGQIDEAFMTVPLDYADPQGDTIELYVTRHRAPESSRVGILFVNNGGPGAAASTIGLNAPRWFEEPIIDRFDVIAWDPRGVGASGGSVDCIDDAEYDRFYSAPDITPEEDDERQALIDLAKEFVDGCVERVGRPLQYIGTNNSARDIDAMRQALEEEQASFFGFSYGGELGGVWATMFPSTVRAAVFDAAPDPTTQGAERSRQQRIGFGAALDTFLAACSADDSCAFHNDGDAEGAYDALMASVDAAPLPADGRAGVNLQVATTGVIRAMYSDRFWPTLERSLEDAVNGDGAGLLALNDSYAQRREDGTYTNLIESFEAISCADEAERLTVEEADAEAATLLEVAPRLFPQTTGSYGCTFFPEALDPRADITGIGAGPIVVVGTTGDPTTPLESSRKMAQALEDGRLIVVEANQHTGYGVNDCVDDAIHDYLVQLTPPDDETDCAR